MKEIMNGNLAHQWMLHILGPTWNTFSATSITNDVITPFYSFTADGSNCSFISKDEPNSVFMWFRDSSNNTNIRDLSTNAWTENKVYDMDDINAVKNFKFVTTNDDELSYFNIIDVSRVSVITLDADVSGNPMGIDISCVRFDLSRNLTDISNVNNPYSFTSRDNINMWWGGMTDLADKYRFADLSGNEIFDSSANVKDINTDYEGNLANDVSGEIMHTTVGSLVWGPGDTPDYYYGLGINNSLARYYIYFRRNCRNIPRIPP